MAPEEIDALRRWRAGIEARTAGRCHAIKRGLLKGPRPVASDAWRCEGRWQADEQLDIWQCIDNAELDERRKRSEGDEGMAGDEQSV